MFNVSSEGLYMFHILLYIQYIVFICAYLKEVLIGVSILGRVLFIASLIVQQL